MGALSGTSELFKLLSLIKATEWHTYQEPAANAAALATIAAPGPGLRNVLLGMIFGIGSTVTAPAGNATPIQVWDNLAGAIPGDPNTNASPAVMKFAMDCGLVAVAGQWQYVSLPEGLIIVGGVNTTLKIGSGGGSGASSFQRLSAHGIVVPDSLL